MRAERKQAPLPGRGQSSRESRVAHQPPPRGPAFRNSAPSGDVIESVSLDRPTSVHKMATNEDIPEAERLVDQQEDSRIERDSIERKLAFHNWHITVLIGSIVFFFYDVTVNVRAVCEFYEAGQHLYTVVASTLLVLPALLLSCLSAWWYLSGEQRRQCFPSPTRAVRLFRVACHACLASPLARYVSGSSPRAPVKAIVFQAGGRAALRPPVQVGARTEGRRAVQALRRPARLRGPRRRRPAPRARLLGARRAARARLGGRPRPRGDRV